MHGLVFPVASRSLASKCPPGNARSRTTKAQWGAGFMAVQEPLDSGSEYEMESEEEVSGYKTNEVIPQESPRSLFGFEIQVGKCRRQ